MILLVFFSSALSIFLVFKIINQRKDFFFEQTKLQKDLEKSFEISGNRYDEIQLLKENIDSLNCRILELKERLSDSAEYNRGLYFENIKLKVAICEFKMAAALEKNDKTTVESYLKQIDSYLSQLKETESHINNLKKLKST